MLEILGVMLLSMGKMILLITPWAGLTIGAAVEQTERDRYHYVVPRDLGTEPYFKEE